MCTGNENSKPIWNKFIIRKDIIETSQVVLNFCQTVYNTEGDKLHRKLLVLAKHTLSTTVYLWTVYDLCCFCIVFVILLTRTFKLCGFPIFWLRTYMYLGKVISETRREHWIIYLRLYLLLRRLFVGGLISYLCCLCLCV